MERLADDGGKDGKEERGLPSKAMSRASRARGRVRSHGSFVGRARSRAGHIKLPSAVGDWDVVHGRALGSSCMSPEQIATPRSGGAGKNDGDMIDWGG